VKGPTTLYEFSPVL
jgi:hypothetical protein